MNICKIRKKNKIDLLFDNVLNNKNFNIILKYICNKKKHIIFLKDVL